MKFACIEHNTKSGQIWRPTSEKPNYLCDQKTEIDMASYGTWTSALNGEHIPLHWFINGKRSPGAAKEAALLPRFSSKLKKTTRRLLKQKIKFNNLEYLRNFDVVLVCHHFWYYEEMYEFLRQAKERYGNIIFLGALPYNLGRVREYWRDPAWYNGFKDFINLVDIFTIVDAAAKDYYQLLMMKPVVYFPTFYPIEYTDTIIARDSAKEKIIFLAGDTRRLDIIWGMHLAKRIQQIFPEYLIQYIKTKDLNTEPLRGARCEALTPLDWHAFLKTINRSKIVINTDVWWTNGRVPADCAAVGTPCMGVNANRQMELFPELVCADIAGTAQAIDLARQLIEDKAFYKKIQENSYKKLKCYSYENSVRQFNKLISLYQHGRMDEWKDGNWLNQEVSK